MTSRRPLTAPRIHANECTGEIFGQPGERYLECAATADEHIVVAGEQAFRVR